MLYYICLSSLYEYKIISNIIKIAYAILYFFIYIIIQKITFNKYFNKKSIFHKILFVRKIMLYFYYTS